MSGGDFEVVGSIGDLTGGVAGWSPAPSSSAARNVIGGEGVSTPEF
jgi:hypothetical protein